MKLTETSEAAVEVTMEAGGNSAVTIEVKAFDSEAKIVVSEGTKHSTGATMLAIEPKLMASEATIFPSEAPVMASEVSTTRVLVSIASSLPSTTAVLVSMAIVLPSEMISEGKIMVSEVKRPLIWVKIVLFEGRFPTTLPTNHAKGAKPEVVASF